MSWSAGNRTGATSGLLIGGPEGSQLPPAKRQRNRGWSLSALTAPLTRWFGFWSRVCTGRGHHGNHPYHRSDREVLKKIKQRMKRQNSFRDYTAESALFVRRALVAFCGYFAADRRTDRQFCIVTNSPFLPITDPLERKPYSKLVPIAAPSPWDHGRNGISPCAEPHHLSD